MAGNPQTFDLIIVGAGPGGSNAAAVALQAGLRVAQIEKHPFPRVKPCAGGITCKSLRSLNLAIEPSLRREFTRFQFNLYDRGGNCYDHRQLLLRMVLRPDFDNDLVRQNLQMPGFQFFDGEPVRRVVYQSGFHVETPRRRLCAPQLVGSDGAYSLINRTFGISRPKAMATAVEVNLFRDQVRGDGALPPCFDWGFIEMGYGWVFPKDDHWSVGLYTLKRGLREVRRQLRDYIDHKGFRVSGDPLETFESHQIPIGGYRLRPPKHPLYLVGDAGGFADAITGEGIYHALESGRLAGQTAVDVHQGGARHRSYYRRLWKSVLPDTLLTYRLSGVVYRHLAGSLRLLEVPWIWRPLVEGFAQGATLSRSLTLAPLYWLRSYRRAQREAVSSGH